MPVCCAVLRLGTDLFPLHCRRCLLDWRRRSRRPGTTRSSSARTRSASRLCWYARYLHTSLLLKHMTPSISLCSSAARLAPRRAGPAAARAAVPHAGGGRRV
jgi:hypothetical protein